MKNLNYSSKGSKTYENTFKNQNFYQEITIECSCHLGRIKQAEVIIHGTSSIHFGPFYKPVNVISALDTIELFLAEVRAGQKSILKDMRNHMFGGKISGFS